MRLRVAVDWDGVTVEDHIHDRGALLIGAGAQAQVSLPGPADAYICIQTYQALAVLEVPVGLVATVRFAEGEIEALLADRSITVSSQTGTCELTLRESFSSEEITRVRIDVLEALPIRRDVALTGWAAAAVVLGTYLAAGVAYTQGAKDESLASPSAQRDPQNRDQVIRWIVDPDQPLVSDPGRLGEDVTVIRDGDGLSSEYAQLLVRGFDRYLAQDLVSANRLWSDAAVLVPGRPEAFINLAQVAKREHRLVEAEGLLRRALTIAPERCEALTDLGLIEAEQDRAEAGKQTLEHARTACGDRLGFVGLHMAAVLSHAGDLVQAETVLTRAVTALVGDTADKRREALHDLEHEPLFARLRAVATFPRLLARLRASLQRPV